LDEDDYVRTMARGAILGTMPGRRRSFDTVDTTIPRSAAAALFR
jgi:hypothetical protein